MAFKLIILAALLPVLGCSTRGVGTPPTGQGGRDAPRVTATAQDGKLAVARVNGVELHYLERGTGEPVVFVHGSLVDYREWEAVAEPLSRAYRTLRYSRRYNYPNDNRLVGGAHSAAVEAEDLAALIRARGLAPAHIVGVSYGGYTALLLALRHPQLVRSLVVVEPPIMPWLPEIPGGAEVSARFFAGMAAPVAAAFRRGDPEAALRLSLDYFVFPGAMDRLPPAMLGRHRANLREWEAITTSSDPFPMITPEELRRVNVPVLVISGEKGFEGARLTDPELARALPRAERLVIAQGTHDVCSERPTACEEAIRKFLGSS